LPVFFRAIHRLPVWRIERKIASDLALPAVAVLEEAILVVVELLARLDGEFAFGPSTMASTGQASSQKPQ
jgi:hypothetical protein